MKIWTFGSSPRSGSRKAWMRIKNFNGAIRLSKFWNFFGAIHMISCRVWWPWTKRGYISMTRRQSNNQWSFSIAAHPTRKNPECKNPLDKFSPRFDFLGSRRHSPHWLSSKGSNYQCGVLLIAAGAIERHFERKSSGIVTKGVLSLHENAPAHRHLQPRRNWSTWAFNVLITHPILRIWPRRNTTCSLDRKQIERSSLFSDGVVISARRLDWTSNILNFFWVAGKS